MEGVWRESGGSVALEVLVLLCTLCVVLLQAVEELSSWDGQCPPTAKHQKGKPVTPKLKEVIGKVR